MANATGRPTALLVLHPEERDYPDGQRRRRRIARSMSERCRIILRCADGIPSKVVAAELGVHEHTVGKWRRRFVKDRIEGLLDEARPGRPRTIDDDQVAAVIERTLRSTPSDATHWSIRSMAGATGFSHTTIRRIWTAFGLQPHRSDDGLASQERVPASSAAATSWKCRQHSCEETSRTVDDTAQRATGRRRRTQMLAMH